MKNVIRKLPVYKKTIFVFILMLSTFYLFSLVLTNVGKKSLENQYLESVTSKADFYGDFLNSQIYYIRNLQLQLFSNSNIVKLDFLGDQVSGYEEVALVNNINEELTNLNSSSELVVNSKLIIKSYKRIIPFNVRFKEDIETSWSKYEKIINEDEGQGLKIYNDEIHLLAMDLGESKISSVQLSRDKIMKDISHIIDE